MTGKKATAKLHHYVPQAYLRGFATADERINVIPLDRTRKPFTPGVKNIAAQNHFYTVDELEEPDAFEKALSEIEGNALGVIKAFERSEFPPSEHDRWELSFYIALQSVRGPDTRKTSEHISASMTRIEVGAGGRENVGAWIRSRLGFDPTPEQEDRIWAEATQPGGPPITYSNLAHIRHAVETAQTLTLYILGRPWTLVRFDRRSLVTSDAPVGLVHGQDTQPWEGVGFGTAWGITFPLTRKLGLLMTDPLAALPGITADDPLLDEVHARVLAGEVDHVELGTTALEKLFNEHTVLSAREYLYHHPDDGRFVPEDLPEPNLINIHPAGGLVDMEFDGRPLFARGRHEHSHDGDESTEPDATQETNGAVGRD